MYNFSDGDALKSRLDAIEEHLGLGSNRRTRLTHLEHRADASGTKLGKLETKIRQLTKETKNGQ